MPKRPKSENDSRESTVGFYMAYLCGVIDTLVTFKGSLYAIDVKQVISETIDSIIKDAWALQEEGKP